MFTDRQAFAVLAVALFAYSFGWLLGYFSGKSAVHREHLAQLSKKVDAKIAYIERRLRIINWIRSQNM